MRFGDFFGQGGGGGDFVDLKCMFQITFLEVASGTECSR